MFLQRSLRSAVAVHRHAVPLFPSHLFSTMSSTTTATSTAAFRTLSRTMATATETMTEQQRQGLGSIPLVPESQSQSQSQSQSDSDRLPVSHRRKALSMSTINPSMVNVQYAVRGELAIKADEYSQQLERGAGSSLPFDKIVTANIGNPQQKGLDQKPITFWRQVISLLEYPELMTHPLADKIYPSDVLDRAKEYHNEIGSTGAYTHSKGVLGIRKKVAKFIEERDGFPADPESIYLTAGASDGVSRVMLLALKQGDGVMIPIPQYPLYTASLAALDCKPLPYYLSESSGWSLSHSVLTDTLKEARKNKTPVKALVVINPGNPTGSCLSRPEMDEIVQLCYDEGILLLADEVYQNNIHDSDCKDFISFKKVLMEMKDPKVRESVELVSFHSISKGISGECGRRGGYFECVNIEEDVMDQLYKISSIALCPPVSGQIAVGLLVEPPKEGSPSYPLYNDEITLIHDNLKSRLSYMTERFNALPGMSCQPAEGAMYLFPKIEMPEAAIRKAKELGKPADVMYALDLLDETGICAVAGSGFGQVDGEYHLRLTALCPGVEEYVAKIETFHKKFMKKYE